jgi:ribonuclease HI
VYTEWSAAQEAIVGWKGPKFKKFDTRAEAEAFVRSFAGAAKPTASTVLAADQDGLDGVEEPPAKKTKTTNKVPNARNGVVVVYTDGSSLGNGRVGATAGVGVYFGAGDPRFVCQPHLSTAGPWCVLTPYPLPETSRNVC